MEEDWRKQVTAKQRAAIKRLERIAASEPKVNLSYKRLIAIERMRGHFYYRYRTGDCLVTLPSAAYVLSTEGDMRLILPFIKAV